MPARYGHRPRASVVVLSHRWRTQPQMVQAAIDSALYQTERDVEVRVEFCEANWPTKLNDAVAGARGEWVVILCDDDLLHPSYLERCLQYADHADVIYTDRRVFRSEAPHEGYHFRMHGDAIQGPDASAVGFAPAEWIFGSSLPMTCCIRRQVWEEMGGHDPHMPHSDTELWYRLAVTKKRFIYVPHPLFFYREHDQQMCRQINTLPDALRCFHRKHFAAFGVTWERRLRGEYETPGTLIPIGERLAYATAHFTDLTTVGYMATEQKDLPESAKLAIQLKQREAQMAINAVITLCLRESGLLPEEGWKVDGDYRAVREVPDAPDDLSVPTVEAKRIEEDKILAARDAAGDVAA